MPQLPKDPRTRQRRNKVTTNRQLPAGGRRDTAGRRLRVPALLDPPDGGEWHSLTLRWWQALWRSPQATQFGDLDFEGLFLLATLRDALIRSPSGRLAAEVRQWEARWGIAPIDQRRLQWEIVDEVPSGRRVRLIDEEIQDPREFLHIVGGDA